jgi:hypothetical protein
MRAHPLRPLDLANSPRDIMLRLTHGKPIAAALAGSSLIFMVTLVSYQLLTPAASQPRLATFVSGTDFTTEPSVPALPPGEVVVPSAPAIAAAPTAVPIAASAPPPAQASTPASVPALDEEIARGVLQRYYAAVNARDYQAAYSLVSSKWQQRQSYADFAAGYSGLRHDDLDILGAAAATQSSASGFVLSVDVTAETTLGRSQRFNGLYFVVLEDGQPKLDSGRLTPV